MPRIVRLHTIDKRLRTRLDIAETGAIEPSELDPNIYKMTLIDELLQDPDIVSAAHDISSGSNVTVATVPSGKRWHPRIVRKGATAGTVPIIMADADGHEIYLASGATGAVNVFGGDLVDIIMEESWSFILTSGGGGDTAITFAYYIKEEDAY